MLEMVAVHDFYETKNECSVAAVHKNHVTEADHALLPDGFIWDRSWTDLGQRQDICPDVCLEIYMAIMGGICWYNECFCFGLLPV